MIFYQLLWWYYEKIFFTIITNLGFSVITDILCYICTGTICNKRFNLFRYFKEQRSIKVVLPEEYKPGSTDKYEVIYLTDGECVMLCVSRLTIRKTYTTELLTQEV